MRPGSSIIAMVSTVLALLIPTTARSARVEATALAATPIAATPVGVTAVAAEGTQFRLTLSDGRVLR